jgi:hypothetical protein
VLFASHPQEKRPFGSPRHRWEDSIIIDLKDSEAVVDMSVTADPCFNMIVPSNGCLWDISEFRLHVTLSLDMIWTQVRSIAKTWPYLVQVSCLSLSTIFEIKRLWL